MLVLSWLSWQQMLERITEIYAKLEALTSTRMDGETHLAASWGKRSKGRGQQEGNHCDHGYTVE